MRQEFTGRDAWRSHFSAPAADLLQIQRVFAGEEIFREALRRCMLRGYGDKLSEPTVCDVLQELTDENPEV